MDSNRGCVSSWESTQVLGSGYSPPGMVVHIVEVGPAARIPLLRCQPTGKLLQVLQYYFLSLTSEGPRPDMCSQGVAELY